MRLDTADKTHLSPSQCVPRSALQLCQTHHWVAPWPIISTDLWQLCGSGNPQPILISLPLTSPEKTQISQWFSSWCIKWNVFSKYIIKISPFKMCPHNPHSVVLGGWGKFWHKQCVCEAGNRKSRFLISCSCPAPTFPVTNTDGICI